MCKTKLKYLWLILDLKSNYKGHKQSKKKTRECFALFSWLCCVLLGRLAVVVLLFSCCLVVLLSAFCLHLYRFAVYAYRSPEYTRARSLFTRSLAVFLFLLSVCCVSVGALLQIVPALTVWLFTR